MSEITDAELGVIERGIGAYYAQHVARHGGDRDCGACEAMFAFEEENGEPADVVKRLIAALRSTRERLAQYEHTFGKLAENSEPGAL